MEVHGGGRRWGGRNHLLSLLWEGGRRQEEIMWVEEAGDLGADGRTGDPMQLCAQQRRTGGGCRSDGCRITHINRRLTLGCHRASDTLHYFSHSCHSPSSVSLPHMPTHLSFHLLSLPLSIINSMFSLSPLSLLLSYHFCSGLTYPLKPSLLSLPCCFSH